MNIPAGLTVINPERACDNDPLQTDVPHVLVTGGAGVVGRNIVSELVRATNSGTLRVNVTVFDLKVPTERRIPQVCYMEGDLTNFEHAKAAIRNVNVVIHTAALKPFAGGSMSALKRVNIDATKTLLELCKKSETVTAFIFTSSASVMTRNDIEGLQTLHPDDPYPSDDINIDDYARTKKAAEKLVLEANGKSLTALAIRPGGVFGPDDGQSFTGVLSLRRKVPIFGNGNMCQDFVDVKSVALAHINALKAAVILNDSKVAGKVYNVGGCVTPPSTQRSLHGAEEWEPLTGKGAPLWLPLWFMLLLAYLNHFAAKLFGRAPLGRGLSPGALLYLKKSWVLDCSSTKRDLDWEPAFKTPQLAVKEYVSLYLKEVEEFEFH